jgi:hypothetical protein
MLKLTQQIQGSVAFSLVFTFIAVFSFQNVQDPQSRLMLLGFSFVFLVGALVVAAYLKNLKERRNE